MSMQMVVFAGAGVALVGVALLLFSGFLALKVRRTADQDEAAAKAALSRVLMWNLAALSLGMLGLITLIIGLILS